MRTALHRLLTGLFAVLYGVLGLIIGACTGFLVLKVLQLSLGLPDPVTAMLQWVVAFWAFFLAGVGAVAYLRASKGERLVT